MVSDKVYAMVDELDDIEERLLKMCNDIRYIIKEFKAELP